MFKTSITRVSSLITNNNTINNCTYGSLKNRSLLYHLINTSRRNIFYISKKCYQNKAKNENLCVSNVKRFITNSSIDSHDEKYYNFDVETFGRLHIKTGDSADIYISPQDIETCPHMNKFDMQVLNGRDNIECFQEKEVINVNSVSSSLHENTECHIKVPVKFDITVTVEGDKDVHLKDMENGSVTISVDKGDCNLHNLKSYTIRVTSHNGNIKSTSTLHSNVVFHSLGDGNVEVDKCLGNSCTIQATRGNISVRTLYVDSSELQTSERGGVSIRDCHGVCHVTTRRQGDIDIGSMDGSLIINSQEGDVDVNISRNQNTTINANHGEVRLSLPESMHATHTTLKATERILLDESIPTRDLICERSPNQNRLINVEGDILIGNPDKESDLIPRLPRTIEVVSGHGSIYLEVKSWMEGLKINA